ncbi:MAG: HD domain-containing protein, partial [Anaerovoracaceae bacterium]
GSVRDFLLGKKGADWDITTNATCEEMEGCFTLEKVIPTGKAHGTLTIIKEGVVAEVTTYRIDGEYEQNRKPKWVSFTTKLEEDLRRRDFTINAMAYHPKTGVVDLFHGKEDLQKGILRTVGQSQARFGEDALRILRCLRFAAQLDFTIHKDTEKGLFDQMDLLDHISAERKQAEISKLICGKGAGRICSQYKEILAKVMPEIRPMFHLEQQNPYHRYDVWEHSIRVMENISPDPVLRLTALLHDVGKPGCKTVDEQGIGHFYGHEFLGETLAESVLTTLKYDNETKKRVKTLIKHHNIVLIPEGRQAKRLLNKLGEKAVFDLIQLELADVRGQESKNIPERVDNIMAFKARVEELLAQGACFSLKDLDLSGKDLLAAGVPQGPLIGETLNRLLNEVMEGRLSNKKEILLKNLK